MNDSSSPSGDPSHSDLPLASPMKRSIKKNINLLLGVLMFLLSFWMLVADVSISGDMLFQGSMSFPLLSLFVMMFSLLAHFLAIVPMRYLIVINLCMILRSGFGYPLNHLLSNTQASIMASAGVTLCSVWYLRSVFYDDEIGQRPWFRWKHLGLTGLALFLLLIISIPYMTLGSIVAMQNLFGDFIQVTPKGISLKERVYENDGHRTHLIGMMHIGDESFYEEIKARLGEKPEGRRVVLQEGVRDRKHILPNLADLGRFYHNISSELGLKMQGRLDGAKKRESKKDRGQRLEELSSKGILFINADIDISDLEEQHRSRLVQMFEMFGATSLTEFFLLSGQLNMSSADLESLIMEGLIGARNDELMKHFHETGLQHDEVYIPWGAAHLKDIEKRLLLMGYTKVEEEERVVVSFW